jgi:hypothetical protein
MLVPAILYKTEIEKAFAKEVYTKDYFYYSGYPHSHSLPEIVAEDYIYQFAIIDENENLLGYLAYWVDRLGDTVYNFGLYSFCKGNYLIGKELFVKMEELVKKYHRIEWRMISGNPVQKHYDKFCKMHHGNVVVLHDVCKDEDGVYHDEYIYEIVNK